MGKIEENLLTGFSGKIGNIVGCKGKYGYYIRTRPVKYRDKKSEKQKQQRNRLTLTTGFLKAITPILRIGYRDYTRTQSSYNAAMSYVMANAIKQTEEGINIDYPKVKIAQGTLTTATDAKVEFEKGKAIFTWKDNSGQGDAQAEDNVMVVVYHKVKLQAYSMSAAALRSDERCQLLIPEQWKANELAAYIALANQERMCVSNSECIWDGAAIQG